MLNARNVFLLRNAKQVLHKSNLHSTLRQCIYDKYKLKFEENTFLNDDSSLRTYCFIKLNTFPTYEKVKKYILQDNETYILNFIKILNITTKNHLKLVMVAKLEQQDQLKNLIIK